MSKKYYKNANNCFSRKERNILHFLWVIKINEKIILFLLDNINEAKLGNFPEIFFKKVIVIFKKLVIYFKPWSSIRKEHIKGYNKIQVYFKQIIKLNSI